MLSQEKTAYEGHRSSGRFAPLPPETAHRLADHHRARLPLGHESVPVIT